MRITHRMIFTDALRGLLDNLKNLSTAQETATTGRRINLMSDAPIDASLALRLDSRIRHLDGFRRNGIAATTRLSAGEAAMDAAEALLRRAKDLAGKSLAPDDPELRIAVGEEARALRDQLVALGNTQVAGDYLFAGAATDAPPFAGDGTYLGAGSPREIEIGEGMRIVAGHAGDAVFSPALQAMADLADALSTGDREALGAAMERLDEAQKAVQAARAVNGIRMSEVDAMQQVLVRNSASLVEQRDALLVADPTEAALQLREASSSLERAYAAVSRVMSTNILDFLR